jgi:hypothetical protein
MIHTSSPINGSKMTLGYVTSNMGMAVGCAYVISVLMKAHRSGETYGGISPMQNERLLYAILAMHILIIIYLVLILSLKLSNKAWYWSKVFGYTLEMFEFTILALITMHLKDIKATWYSAPDRPYWAILQYTWLVMELFSVMAYIISNVIYLSVRFVTHNELLLFEPSLKSHAKTDFVEAQFANINMAGSITSSMCLTA